MVERNLSQSSMVPRSLSLYGGVMTIVSLMIGAGIFTAAGQIHGYTGMSGFTMIIWVVSALLGLTGALCYAELGTMFPASGGEHQYLGSTFGPMFSFLFDLVSIFILKPGTNAIFAQVFGSHFVRLIYQSQMEPFFDDLETHPEKDVAFIATKLIIQVVSSVICVLVATLLAAMSPKWSDRVMNCLTFSKLFALAAIILGGLVNFILHPEVLKSAFAEPFSNGSRRVGDYAVVISEGLWSYDGWNNLNVVAGELTNVSTNLPLAIWISMSVVSTIYILTIIGYYAVVPIVAYGKSTTLGILYGYLLFGKAGAIILPLFVMASVFSSMLSNMTTSSRIVCVASEDGHMPKTFGVISKRFNSPVYAMIQQSSVTILIVVGIQRFEGLVTLYTFPQWFFYCACVIALLVLRVRSPDLERPYKVWITTPVLFVLACLALIVCTAFDAFSKGQWYLIVASVALVLAGIPVWLVLIKGKPSTKFDLE